MGQASDVHFAAYASVSWHDSNYGTAYGLNGEITSAAGRSEAKTRTGIRNLPIPSMLRPYLRKLTVDK